MSQGTGDGPGAELPEATLKATPSPASPEDRSWTLGLPACASPPVPCHVHIGDAFSPPPLPPEARCHPCHPHRRSRIPIHSLLHQQGVSG